MTKGIDISSHQGTEIDFHKVKAAGYSFVIVRAGYGTKVSQTFAPQLEGAQAAGLDTGAYWYSYATSKEAANREVATCLEAIKPYKLTYPVYFDQEYEPVIQAVTKKERTEICKTFLGALETAGYYAGIYASKDWLENWLEPLPEYDKWVAQYASKCTYQGDFGMWQFTGNGKVDGIPAAVDINECYKDYPEIIKKAGLNHLAKKDPPVIDYKAKYFDLLEDLQELINKYKRGQTDG